MKEIDQNNGLEAKNPASDQIKMPDF